MRRIAALPLALTLIAVLSSTLLADPGDQLWMFQGIEDINAMATLPDVDGDGVPDVLIETYDAGGVGDHLYLVSGGDTGTPAILWSARPNSGASDGGGYGDNCLAVSPDLSGDGFPDVLLGTAWGNRSVHAFDGRTGAVLWTFDTYDEADSGWVYSVATHPDRTGDGIPEVIAACGSDNDSGYLLSGADGSVIWRFLISLDALSLGISLPDMNGDGTPDVLFTGQDNDHRVYCVNGASGPNANLLWFADVGSSLHGATLIDDVNGDTKPDVVVGKWSQAGQVLCLSGANGAQLWAFDNGSYNYIMRLVTISDVNGDGYADIAVGSWDNAVRVVSGLDGTMIWQSYAGSLNGGDFWSVERVDDVTGDGLDEVVGGSFDTKVYLFDGASGDTLWIKPTGFRLYSVRGAPDLSGNGSPDVLAGTQYLSSGGRAFAIEGGDAITGLPGMPFASGTALASAGGGIELRWRCDQPLGFNVYRVEDGFERGARRADLLAAHAAGAMGSRELIAAVRSESESLGLRINALPVAPTGSDASAWLYEFADAAAGAAYRLAALLPGGGEVLLAELSPRPAAPATPLIAAAAIHPNPFNPATRIRFTLSRPASLSLLAHDGSGRRVATLPPRSLPAGVNEIAWTGEAERGGVLPSGVYFVTLLADTGESHTLRAVLIK